MGRHSRKGPAPTHRGADDRTAAVAPGGGRRRREAPAEERDAGEAEQRPPAPPRPRQEPAAPPRRTPGGPAPRQYGYDHGPATPPHGTPAHAPSRDVRGGHPEQREPGGGWGGAPYDAGPPRPGIAQDPPRAPGPRREFVEAFDGPAEPDARDASARPAGDRPAGPREARAGGPGARAAGPAGSGAHDGRDGGGGDARDEGRAAGRGRTLTGVAAAAVVTVLAVVVAGQVDDARQQGRADRAVDAPGRDGPGDAASRSEQRTAPPRTGPSRPAPVGPATYAQMMARQFPFDPAMKGSGEFEAVPGMDEAPGKGRKLRYRVDVEKGLGLDGGLFARAVQQTLNDDRSWAHGGAMTFERISTGRPDFVVTLASPGTTAVWCAKSGLDTTVDNVSCDSAATDRVMINAFRWARGADTFGPGAMLAYRQMLINHEVGHRLGHNHRTCQTPGAPAPVMQQQTKSLEIDGIKCRPNPWAYPGD